ncbi:MAG: sialate O-acetylesterase [Prolixibacteraceae bacterium]
MKRITFPSYLFLAALTFLLVVCTQPLTANVSMPSFFTDNMVFQQQSDVPVWGNAEAGENITVTTSWNNRTYTAIAGSDGKWTVKVQTPEAGYTPYEMSIKGRNTIQLKNILIGEVWVCSGQSNMEMPLAGWGKVLNYEKEIADANYPSIRLLRVANTCTSQPQSTAKLEGPGWVECSPATIPEFSSVAYLFARDILKSQNIPVGLIDTNWGGTVAEAWTSASTLKLMPDFAAAVTEIEAMNEEEGVKAYPGKLAAWEDKVEAADLGYSDGKAVWAAAGLDDSGWDSMHLPGLWEEKMPGFDGIVWFRKTITLPASQRGKELTLSLDVIDDNERTFCNGELIGATSGYNQQRIYKIPARLTKSGTLQLAVWVMDTGGGGGIYGDTAKLFLAAGADKITLSGDWKYKAGADLKTLPPVPQDPGGNPNRPSVLYNAMIHPLVPFTIRGAIWYQGESNAGRAYQYRDLFPLMIKDWREKWNTEIAFYFVQLANFMNKDKEPVESAWAELREAQTMALHLAHTGMAVTIDIGDSQDIHPKNKQEVGHRLALAARANTYGEKIDYSGPLYETYRSETGQIRLSFRFNEGLKSADGKTLAGFAVAGPDRKFYWAEAVIEGNEVVVRSPKVKHPLAVRYAWANNPDCNLTNRSGLPASPFRTDQWPGVTK